MAVRVAELDRLLEVSPNAMAALAAACASHATAALFHGPIKWLDALQAGLCLATCAQLRGCVRVLLLEHLCSLPTLLAAGRFWQPLETLGLLLATLTLGTSAARTPASHRRSPSRARRRGAPWPRQLVPSCSQYVRSADIRERAGVRACSDKPVAATCTDWLPAWQSLERFHVAQVRQVLHRQPDCDVLKALPTAECGALAQTRRAALPSSRCCAQETAGVCHAQQCCALVGTRSAQVRSQRQR